jgi:hypothetical protein
LLIVDENQLRTNKNNSKEGFYRAIHRKSEKKEAKERKKDCHNALSKSAYLASEPFTLPNAGLEARPSSCSPSITTDKTNKIYFL